MNAPLECSQCRTGLTADVINRPELTPCPRCGTLLQVEVFPALFRQTATGRDGEALTAEGEASCFYHPQKKAVLPCAACGRFLCALCDCELHGQHFCPPCLEAGRTKGKIQRLETERTLYDSIALWLTIVPLVIIYFTVVTAPMALFIAIRYWNAPRSLVHRTKIRLVLAIILATLEIAGWCWVIYFFTTHFKRHA
jgi:hypothetical protein